jgi:hypothetical protein
MAVSAYTARKSYPLPAVTDTEEVRITFRDLSTKADRNTFFDFAETITALWDFQAGIRSARTVVGDVGYSGLLTTDSVARITILSDGKIEWGPGGAASRDVNLFRSAADTLKTDDSLIVAGTTSLVDNVIIGSGSAPNNQYALQVTGSITTGSSQYGVFVNSTIDNGATQGYAMVAQIITAAAAYTLNGAYSFYAANASKGAGSSISTQYGLYIEVLSAAGTNYGIYVNAPTGGNNAYGIYCEGRIQQVWNETLTTDLRGHNIGGTPIVNATMETVAGLLINTGVTVNATRTLTRFAELLLSGATATVNGTLTNHNTLYVGGPVGGTQVRTIDTHSGAYLSTAGAWTSVSWAKYKENIQIVSSKERSALLDWLCDEYRPVRYRYKKNLDKKGNVIGPYDQDYEYDHFGFLVDDLPLNIRKIICADNDGAVNSKDTDGLLLALVQELAIRVKQLEQKKEVKN